MSNFVHESAFPQRSSAITKSDTTVLDLRGGMYVGTGGDVALMLFGDSAAVTHKNVPSGSFIPLHIAKVMSTNTTAADMVGYA